MFESVGVKVKSSFIPEKFVFTPPDKNKPKEVAFDLNDEIFKVRD